MSSWWFRLDGEFVENPKVMDLSDRAFRLHVAGLCYTTRNLTDGMLVDRAVKVVCALTAASRRHIVELRDSGLWIARDDGYEIKDYLIHNPDAATVKELRNARREAGRKGGLKSAATRRKNQPLAEANLEADAEASASRFASKHGTEQENHSVSNETGPGQVVVLAVDQAGSQQLVAQFVDSARTAGVEVPRKVVGHLAREIKTLLEEGQPPAAVWAGLARMVERRLVQPALLANFVMEASLPRFAGERADASRFGRGLTTQQILDKAKEAS